MQSKTEVFNNNNYIKSPTMAENHCAQLSKVLPQQGSLFVPYVLNCVIMLVLSLTAIVGNVLILVSICRAPQFLRQPSYFLLVNLAFADFCVGLIAEPAYLVYKLSYLVDPFSLLSCYAGIIFNFLSYFLTSLSLWTAATISLDRLLVLHLHMKYSAIVTKCRVCILIAVLWLLGIIFGSMFDWAVDAQNTVFVCANTMALLIALLSYVRIFQIVRYHRKQISIQLSEVSFWHRDEDNSVYTSFCRKDSTSKQWEDAMSEEMDGNESVNSKTCDIHIAPVKTQANVERADCEKRSCSTEKASVPHLVENQSLRAGKEAVTGSEARQIGVTKPENHQIKTLGVAKASLNYDRVLSSSKREVKGTEAFERGQESSNGLANSNLKFSKNTGNEQNQDNVVGLKEVHTESLASKNWIMKSWQQNQKCASVDCTIVAFKEDTQNEDGSSDGRDQEGVEETYKRPSEEKAGLKENQNPTCSFEDNAVWSERQETDQEQRNLTEVMQENSVSHRKDTKNTSNHSQIITSSNRHAQSSSSANYPTTRDNQIAIRSSKRLKMRHFKKSVFNMFVIWFLMLVCYLPLICTSALFTLLGRSYSMHLAFNFTTSVMFLNSSMNPVVFCWRIREFRAAVRKTLRELFGFWANQISRIENFSSTIN